MEGRKVGRPRKDSMPADDSAADVETAPLPSESDFTPAHLELDRILAEYALEEGEVTFHIFREGRGGIKDLSFISSMPPSDFSYEMLKSEPYNGGKFRVYIRNGSGIKRNFGVSAEAIKLPPPKEKETEGAIAAMIAAMSAGFQTLSQQIRQQPPAAAGPNFQDMLALLAAVKPLMMPAAPAQTQDPLDLLSKVITLQNELTKNSAMAEADPSQAILLEAIRSFGPMLGKMASAQAPQTIDQAPAPAAALPPPAAMPAPEQPQPETTDMDIKFAVLKPMILIMAANDRDPYPYACMVIDTFSEEEITQYINAADWWEQLLAKIPEAKDYKPWFDRLRAEVLTILTEEPESPILGKTTPP